MANKNLFRSLWGAMLGKTDTVNEEGAPAYAFGPRHALAQYAATGCLNATFYAGAEEQLDRALKLAAVVLPEFVAKTAVYARERGSMKDLPALLCAVLAVRDGALLKRIFPRVIDNGRMLRTFVQILRSGAVGRKSLGSLPRNLVRGWFEARTDEQVFQASVGQDPSLADVIKLTHPKPASASREALYGYLIGRDSIENGAPGPDAKSGGPRGRAFKAENLPAVVQAYEAYKADPRKPFPEAPFQMLTTLELDENGWTQIAMNATWQMTRMNLNTFARHGVFKRPERVERIAARLRDTAEIAKARAFPYQMMVAFMMADPEVPDDIREALQDAMETAIGNVPALAGKIYVCPDVSGSMSSPVTGVRKGATSKVRCVDVAALVAAAIVRKNPTAEVLPFEDKVVRIALNERDSVMTNAEKLASIGGGGTSCSAPLELLNRRGAKGDLVVMVSDNQSWMDTRATGTATLQEWNRFKRTNPSARLACLDIQPYGSTQVADRQDILNVGGFSDAVFEVISEFAAGRLDSDHWVGVVENVKL
jgi:60 kDa SS-A/Ro ribonucleoprotein